MENHLFRYNADDFNIRRTITTGQGDSVSLALHSHTSYEIFMLDSEKASFFADGTIYHMTQGDVMIFNSTELHNVSFDNRRAYERFVIHFKPAAVLSLDGKKNNLLHIFTSRKNGKHNYIPKSKLENTDFYEIVKKIEASPDVSADFRDIYCRTLFIQMLIILNEAASLSDDTDYPKLNNEKIRGVLAYIDDHLTEDMTLDELAEMFFISKYTLCHRFKKTTGFSVKQYITFRRIAAAQKLMANGSSTLDACFAAGFNDYSNFYKTFKKLLGKPPKKFK